MGPEQQLRYKMGAAALLLEVQDRHLRKVVQGNPKVSWRVGLAELDSLIAQVPRPDPTTGGVSEDALRQLDDKLGEGVSERLRCLLREITWLHFADRRAYYENKRAAKEAGQWKSVDEEQGSGGSGGSGSDKKKRKIWNRKTRLVDDQKNDGVHPPTPNYLLGLASVHGRAVDGALQAYQSGFAGAEKEWADGGDERGETKSPAFEDDHAATEEFPEV